MSDAQLGWQARGLMQGFPPPPEARITRDNWNRFPQSIWSFQHASRLFRSRRIARAQKPRPMLVNPVDFNAVRVPDGKGASLDWNAFLTATHTDALVVLKDGVLVCEHYGRDMTAQSPHMVFSITKSLTGLIAQSLAGEGRLNLDSTVAAYVPELGESAFGEVALRDVMDMLDGVAFDETYANPHADIHRYSAAYWGPRSGHPPISGVYEALTGFKTRMAPPGAVFRYKTPSADVVGWALQKATGESLGDLVENRIWQVIGAQDDAYMIVDPSGQEIAATGFNATARDLARLGQALLDGGRVGGQQVFSEATLASILQGGDRALFARAGYASRSGWSYRSHWWHTHAAGGAYCALGVYGQRLYVDPGNCMVIVKLGSAPEADNTLTDHLHQAAFEAIVARVR
ncbi:serine hydrolase [Asticcacaulis sp. AC402]|uniref:serine hydrolase domain-containing protein n=1 Tax=Asticcacaulis sp. AC402 TaxID=1282361 RepID=UPI0003C3C8EB|nr:serine hydrolase [Asticcacaulis sp. AC402]ESQ74789.1 hypothetical protein ABAC402_12855 [Asticcacaulis sp. AC402]